MQRPTPPSSHRSAARYLVIAVAVALLAGLIANPGQAAKSGKTITIGETNDDAQRQELLGYFGASGDDDVKIVTVAETQKAMEKIIPGFSLDSAYSSTALTCRELGEGIDVSALNITKITPAMYAVALVTAGVGDAELIVAAPAAAPAQGMTALAGVFQSWKSNPCESSNTTRERQELALRELALALDLSTVIGAADTGFAGNFVIDVQRQVVIDAATSKVDIAAIVASQEAVYGFTVPEPQRDTLVTLMVDLQKLKIDWSTFSAGWTIDFGATGIKMAGDGVAIANAQASATAQAATEQTATAQARKDLTATAKADARLTATAAAEQTAIAASRTAEAEAEQTRTAQENLTATALAQPTVTPSPTPLPVGHSGEIAAVTAPVLSVDEAGATTDYTVQDAATITRDSKVVALADLKRGDAVALQVDPATSQVVAVVATAPKSSPFAALGKLLLGIPLLALIPIGIVLRGKSFGDPFIVKRVSR